MNFKQSQPNDNFIYREVSENGLIEIGIYPAMFGFRVRAGFVTDQYFHIDWCAGDNQFIIERLYSILKDILSKRDEDPYCFRLLLTHSKIKPFFNDVDFVKWLSRHVPEELKEEKLPDLFVLKTKYMDGILSDIVK